MDRIYISPDEETIFYLDCTRVDKIGEIVARKKEPLELQIKRIATRIQDKKVVLADDVVFSGSVLKKIIKLLSQEGIEVIGIISAISTQKGYGYFNKTLKEGLKTNILLGEKVIDQICERDFYFGIAGSGIQVQTEKGLVKAPYFYPFGDPVERASIPKEKAKTFSKGCIERSKTLWAEIDSLRGIKTKIKELPEKIINTEGEEEVVKVLQKKGRKL